MQNTNRLLLYPSYAEIWNRVVYYGLQATLVVYLVQQLGLTKDKAYELYGTYSALTLGFSILGGIVADRYLGFYYSVIFGSVLIVVGNLVLCIANVDAVCVAITCISLGIGLFKPNNSNLVTELIGQPSNHSKYFALFYLVLNIGSLLGPILYGFGEKQLYICNIVSAIGVISSNIFLYRGCYKRNLCAGVKSQSSVISKTFLTLSLVVMIGLISFLIHFENIVRAVIFSLIFVNIILFVRIVKQTKQEERVSLISLVVPIISSVVFLIALLQIYTSFLTYVSTIADRQIFNFTIPTPWFSSLEPFFLLVLGPILLKFSNASRFSLSDFQKIFAGLCLAVISFICMAISTYTTDHLQLVIILIANALLAISELWIIPTSIASISLKAPLKFKSTIMAIYYSCLAVSGYFAGALPKISKFFGEHHDNNYRVIFLLIAAILFITMLSNKFILKFLYSEIPLINLKPHTAN